MKKIIVTLLSLYIMNGWVNAQISKLVDFDGSGRNGYIISSFTAKEVMGNGVHCIVDGGDDIFIQNVDAYSDRHYGKTYVWQVGSYEYTTVLGSQRRIPKVKLFSDEDKQKYDAFVKKRKSDFIEKANELEKRQQEIENNRINEERKKQLEIENQRQEAENMKHYEKVVKLLQNRKEQATNGLPTFQYQLGVSYITGADGETNKSLGRYWLIRSAIQGNEDAEKYLKELK